MVNHFFSNTETFVSVLIYLSYNSHVQICFTKASKWLSTPEKKFTKKRFCGSLKGWYRPVCLFVCLFFPLVFPECLCSTSWLRSCLLKFANLELLAEGPSKELSFLTPETLHEQKNIQKKGINFKKKGNIDEQSCRDKTKAFSYSFPNDTWCLTVPHPSQR